jgi:glycosyltransferase involved in cell wall biosynthesis
MKVLHLSTVGLCGNATYTFNLVEQLDGLGVTNEVYPIDTKRLKTLDKAGVWAYFQAFCDRAQDFDVVHIQHEFSFFGGSFGMTFSNEIVGRMLNALQDKKVMMSLHASPGVMFKAEYQVSAKPLDTGPRRRQFYRKVRFKLRQVFSSSAIKMWRQSVAPHFTPEKGCVALVHNQFTRVDMVDAGSHPSQIRVVNIGVETLPSQEQASHPRAEAVKRYFDLQPGDKVLGTFGFISPNKGHHTVIEALWKLPKSYKLLLVGGPHPSGDQKYLNHLLSSAYHYEVADRVYVTGHYEYDELKHYSDLMDLVIVPYLPPYPGSSASTSISLSEGKAIMASNIPTFREIKAQVDCIELVEPNSPYEMAQKIRQLFCSPERLAHLSQNAKTFAHANSWYEVARTHLALYEAL